MYKKFICIALFLVMLASVACVSASEDIGADSDTLANVDEIEVQTSPMDESSAEDVLAAESNKTVSKLDPNLDANIETDDMYITVTSTVNENATGNVSVQVIKLNDKNYTPVTDTSEIENGTARWAEMVSFDKGDYIVEITYSGDNNYYSTSIYKVFAITKHIVDFKVNITTENEFVKIVALVSPEATGNVTFRVKTFAEENYTEYATVEIENGTATWADQMPFNKGDYVAYTTYSGDKTYFKAGDIRTFTIEKEIPDFDVAITVNEYLITLNATLPANATGNVTVRIKTFDEENYTEYATLKVENGTAFWNESAPFNKGDYVAYVKYGGDANYFRSESIQTFTIEKQLPSMVIDTSVNGTNVTIKITLPENATGTVTLTNNQTGEVKTATLNGEPIEFNETLQEMYNVFHAKYSGDDYYFGTEDTVVEGLKIKTSLITKNTISVTYQNTAKVTVKLNISGEYNISSDGENISITVNNKTYVGTLKNGAVTINITASYADKLIPNNYTANVTFEGNDRLKNASSSFVLVVKKGNPKLTANAKTFKVSVKTKKYTITLKNHKSKVMKNTKVTLKINGKTFKATTDSKGKATFSLTNLNKRAKYIALIKYAGNKYYNAVSKKVTITVNR